MYQKRLKHAFLDLERGHDDRTSRPQNPNQNIVFGRSINLFTDIYVRPRLLRAAVIRKRGLIRSCRRATVRTRRLAIYTTKQVRACNKFTATFMRERCSADEPVSTKYFFLYRMLFYCYVLVIIIRY